MDIDEVRLKVRELCERLAMKPLPVQTGEVPEWCSDGVHVKPPRIPGGGWRLIVGGAFPAAPPLAQVAALAGAVGIVKLYEKQRFQRVGLGIALIALGWTGGAALEYIPFPFPLALVIILVAGEALLFGFATIRSRLNVYRIDRWVARSCGTAVVEAGLDHAVENPPRGRGPRALLARIAVPHPDRRAARLGRELPGSQIRIRVHE